MDCHFIYNDIQFHSLVRKHRQFQFFCRLHLRSRSDHLLGARKQLHPQNFGQKYIPDCDHKRPLFRNRLHRRFAYHRRNELRRKIHPARPVARLCGLRPEHFHLHSAQKYLGAAKTSAFYAFAPFIGVLFSVVLLNEKITLQYIVAFLVMIAGTIFVVYDTLLQKPENK